LLSAVTGAVTCASPKKRPRSRVGLLNAPRVAYRRS
jgi:hypothetical protein